MSEESGMRERTIFGSAFLQQRARQAIKNEKFPKSLHNHYITVPHPPQAIEQHRQFSLDFLLLHTYNIYCKFLEGSRSARFNLQ
jgi:hypothetical protein